MSRYAFGIDVGGTSVKLGLLTIDGEVVEKWEIDTDTSEAYFLSGRGIRHIPIDYAQRTGADRKRGKGA